MSRNAESGQNSQAGTFLGLIWGAEVGLALALIGVYKVPEWGSISITSPWIVVACAGLGVAFSCGVVVVRRLSRHHPGSRHEFAVALGANLITLAFLGLAVEMMLRLLVVDAPLGKQIGAVTLHRSWEETLERNRMLLERVYSDESASPYFVPDPDLGWVVGENRSALGLYASGQSGIRTAVRGEAIEEDAGLRVALVGDSYAFSMEVGYEASFGAHLDAQMEKELGIDVQVLNFGVDGYGIDQAHLRYLRDVRGWNPDVVLFCFRQHDLYRSMAVYAFLAFPSWEFPFAKPRFVLEGDGLRLATGRLPDPWQITELDAPGQLPLIELESAFDPLTARLQAAPYVVRYLTAVLPRWPDADPETTRRETMLVNRRLLNDFAKAAGESGTTAFGVFFAAGAEDDYPTEANALAHLTFAGIILPIIDLAGCLREVPRAARRVEGGTHNSDAANRAAARCVAKQLRNLPFLSGI